MRVQFFNLCESDHFSSSPHIAHRGRPGLAGRAGLVGVVGGDLYIMGIGWFVDEVFHQDKSSHTIQSKT